MIVSFSYAVLPSAVLTLFDRNFKIFWRLRVSRSKAINFPWFNSIQLGLAWYIIKISITNHRYLGPLLPAACLCMGLLLLHLRRASDAVAGVCWYQRRLPAMPKNLARSTRWSSLEADPETAPSCGAGENNSCEMGVLIWRLLRCCWKTSLSVWIWDLLPNSYTQHNIIINAKQSKIIHAPTFNGFV